MHGPCLTKEKHFFSFKCSIGAYNIKISIQVIIPNVNSRSLVRIGINLFIQEDSMLKESVRKNKIKDWKKISRRLAKICDS